MCGIWASVSHSKVGECPFVNVCAVCWSVLVTSIKCSRILQTKHISWSVYVMLFGLLRFAGASCVWQSHVESSEVSVECWSTPAHWSQALWPHHAWSLEPSVVTTSRPCCISPCTSLMTSTSSCLKLIVASLAHLPPGHVRIVPRTYNSYTDWQKFCCHHKPPCFHIIDLIGHKTIIVLHIEQLLALCMFSWFIWKKNICQLLPYFFLL